MRLALILGLLSACSQIHLIRLGPMDAEQAGKVHAERHQAVVLISGTAYAVPSGCFAELSSSSAAPSVYGAAAPTIRNQAPAIYGANVTPPAEQKPAIYGANVTPPAEQKPAIYGANATPPPEQKPAIYSAAPAAPAAEPSELVCTALASPRYGFEVAAAQSLAVWIEGRFYRDIAGGAVDLIALKK